GDLARPPLGVDRELHVDRAVQIRRHAGVVRRALSAELEIDHPVALAVLEDRRADLGALPVRTAVADRAVLARAAATLTGRAETVAVPAVAVVVAGQSAVDVVVVEPGRDVAVSDEAAERAAVGRAERSQDPGVA